jgi:hypothetical protein
LKKITIQQKISTNDEVIILEKNNVPPFSIWEVERHY